MDRGAWWAAVHGVAKSQTRLSDFPFPFHFHAFEKEMASHSSVLAWRIPETGEPGGLPSMGSHRVGHDWSDLAAAVYKSLIHKDTLLLIHLNTFVACFPRKINFFQGQLEFSKTFKINSSHSNFFVLRSMNSSLVKSTSLIWFILKRILSHDAPLIPLWYK